MELLIKKNVQQSTFIWKLFSASLEKWKALIESNKLISLRARRRIFLVRFSEKGEKQGSVYSDWHKVISSRISFYAPGARAIKWNRRRVHTAWGASARERKKEMRRADEAINHFAFTDFFWWAGRESMREARTQQLNRIRTQREINKTRSPSSLNSQLSHQHW